MLKVYLHWLGSFTGEILFFHNLHKKYVEVRIYVTI